MANHERDGGTVGTTSADGGSARPPKTRSAGIVRALVAAAVAAAAPAAGCYESDPGDDVADSADTRDSADARDVPVGEVYGMPDGASDMATVYSVPPYGAPEYAAPDYGMP